MKQKTPIPNTNLYDHQQILFPFDDGCENIDSNKFNTIFNLDSCSNNILVKFKKQGLVLENEVRVCPKCGSHHAHKHSLTNRTLRFFDTDDLSVKVMRYKCQSCGKTFNSNIDDIVSKYRNFTNDFKDKLYNYLVNTESTLFEVKYMLEDMFGVSVSHQTIENYFIELFKPLEYDNLSCRGYLIFDVEWVKLNGTWKYRFTLFDAIENRVIANKIYDRENKANLEEFIVENTKNITVKCITTDLANEYGPIFDKLRYNHQYCLFHTKKTINKHINTINRKFMKEAEAIEKQIFKLKTGHQNKSKIQTLKEEYDNKISKINEYKDLKDELYSFIDNEDYFDSINQINNIYNNMDKFDGDIKNFIKNKLRNQAMKFKLWIKDVFIPNTSNLLENYYSKTMSKRFKRKYKTDEGILARIYSNEIRYELNKKRRKYYS